jgi:uncharacterized protein YukJ
MPIKDYGVLKGRPIDTLIGKGKDPHYQIHVVDNQADYRIAVNIKSQEAPSDLEYDIDESFENAITEQLDKLEPGFHLLESKPGGLALDFIRSNLFHPSDMTKLPFGVATPAELDDKLDAWVQRALADEKAMVYAFGQRWQDPNRDPYFGFSPGQGVHDIHMNQGNDGRFTKDDGVYQDGALLLQIPSATGESGYLWVAVFLKFQSQPWHTDDRTGHAIAGEAPAAAGQPAGQPLPTANIDDVRVRIVSATVKAPAGGAESVTLLNGSPEPVDLTGWKIANTNKDKAPLPKTTLAPGATLRVDLPAEVPLSNSGGIITLLDARGMKVFGVSYTRNQAKRHGWSIVF